MQIFKKILLSVFMFVTLFVLVSSIVICPYYNSAIIYNQDREIRQQLSGQIDYVVTGASHALVSFVPEILDNQLGCNSYNLSVSMMPMYARYVLLEKEFARNDIDTVVLEISYDTLQRDDESEYAIGDEPTLVRLDSWGERFNYLVRYVSVDNWLNIYSRSFVMGLWWYKNKLLGIEDTYDFSDKGYLAKRNVDVTLSEESAKQTYSSIPYTNSFNENSYDLFMQIIELCRKNGARVIIATVPVSDSLIWQYDNLDDYIKWGKEFSKKNGCEFYDFNLINNRYDVFNDSYSFADDNHMSDMGAKEFSLIYCDFLNRTKVEDVSSYFYDSYEELKNESPYQQYIH